MEAKPEELPLERSKIPICDRQRKQTVNGFFSSLGQQIQNKRVLDLFAGSGSYGLEALSRGATDAIFVEKKP